MGVGEGLEVLLDADAIRLRDMKVTTFGADLLVEAYVENDRALSAAASKLDYDAHGNATSLAIAGGGATTIQYGSHGELLGAVLPEMRLQVEALAADLAELVRLRKQIAGERDRLARDLLVLADDRLRLSMFIDERQKRQAEAELALNDERQRAAQLARQAENLNQLIVKLEQGLDTASRASRAAARSGEERKANGRPDLAALRDPGRLSPAIAFGSAKGMLSLPVNGARIREFGAPDGVGGTEKGLSIAARPGRQITAPCDGWVVYAGPFRNYGQLLILNAGGGYHVLLAGMERISVDLGQFVVTGEPVAAMGGGAQAAAAIAGGSSQPVLYVEFRKDGVPVDPGPWWAANEGQKVRG